MDEEGLRLPEGAVDLGHDTLYTRAERDGEWVGIHEWHREGGRWTAGFIPFRGRLDSPVTWEVISEEPLTLSPSLACRTCGHHGFITAGAWIPC